MRRRAWKSCLGALLAALMAAPLLAAQIEVVQRGAGALAAWRPSPIPPQVLERARERERWLAAQAPPGLESPLTEPRFIWPLRQAAGWDHARAWATVSFVDHDPRSPGYLLDYHGGERTYDTDFGYNHQGTDLLTWPFGWTKALLGQVEVVAAAAGRIVEKIDGSFDQECGADFSEDRVANLVAVAHADHSIAIYGHLKRGSLTRKEIGQRVRQGEYLGVVGSSGYSGYTHLHFEVMDFGDRLFDPFAGPHNRMNAESWWARQPRYYEPGMFTLMTHRAPPNPVACNYAERTRIARRFAPGEEAFLAIYFRDRKAGDRVRYRVLDPTGRVFARGKERAGDEYFAISWLVLSVKLPDDAPHGTWTFRAKAYGRTLQRSFEVGRFEPGIGVGSVRPRRVAAGGRRRIRIHGFGFPPDLVADVHRPDALERRIEVLEQEINPRRIVLTLRLPADAHPGPRRIVLTAPDYTQILIDKAFRVRRSPTRP